MADQQIAEQFIFWKDNLASSVIEVTDILKGQPMDVDARTDAFSGLQIDLQKLQTFQPGDKRKVSYEYKDALPVIACALHLESKIKRILGQSDSSSISSGQSNVAANAIQRKIGTRSSNSNLHRDLQRVSGVHYSLSFEIRSIAYFIG